MFMVRGPKPGTKAKAKGQSLRSKSKMPARSNVILIKKSSWYTFEVVQ